MKQNEPISKIMSSNPKSIQVGQKLSVARRLIAEGKFEHVPVVNGEVLVGLLSLSDMMRLTFDAGNVDARTIDAVLDSQFTVEGTMTKNLHKMRATETIRTAAEHLVNGAYHSIPVVGEGDKLVGIVTSTDLIRYLLEQY